jgi:hypothetical protein
VQTFNDVGEVEALEDVAHVGRKAPGVGVQAGAQVVLVAG